MLYLNATHKKVEDHNETVHPHNIECLLSVSHLQSNINKREILSTKQVEQHLAPFP